MTFAPLLLAAAATTSDTPMWLVPLVIGAFLLLFPLFWMAVIRLSALMGWAALADRYRFDGTFPDEMQAFKSASLSIGRGPMMANYSGIAVVLIRPEALYIRLRWLFAFGHPPVKLPWDEIETISHGKMLVWTNYRLRFKGAPITLLLRGVVGRSVDTAWKRHRR